MVVQSYALNAIDPDATTGSVSLDGLKIVALLLVCVCRKLWIRYMLYSLVLFVNAYVV